MAVVVVVDVDPALGRDGSSRDALCSFPAIDAGVLPLIRPPYSESRNGVRSSCPGDIRLKSEFDAFFPAGFGAVMKLVGDWESRRGTGGDGVPGSRSCTPNIRGDWEYVSGECRSGGNV